MKILATGEEKRKTDNSQKFAYQMTLLGYSCVNTRAKNYNHAPHNDVSVNDRLHI